MRTARRQIDWRSQFAALEPYLTDQGGVVHVHVGERSPVAEFMRVFAGRIGSVESPTCMIVQLDPANYNTHFVADIIVEIADVLNIELSSAEPRNHHIHIGEQIRTRGGDVSLSGISVSLGQEAGEPAAELMAQLRQLKVGLMNLLVTHRVAILLVNTHEYDADNLRILRRLFWHKLVEGLLPSGLLLVDVFNPTTLAATSDAWPPEADLTLQLPDRFDPEAESHALDDFTAILLEERLFDSRDAARGFAMGVLGASFDVQDFHSRVAVAVSRLSGWSSWQLT